MIKKSKVLVIDDTPANIQILNSLLTEDHQVLFATNGHDGISIAKRELPDIILLDIMMPDMDGYAVIRELKNESDTIDIPVIFVTAMEEEHNENKGLELGAVDYITKPIKPAIAKLRIKNHIELKQNRDFLKKLSNVDGLTGIGNRRNFDEHLNREWRRALRKKVEIALLVIDIDHFKLFNDEYGHLAGDVCLRKVAETLSLQANRPCDLVARYGGEEFACILPETNLEAAEKIAGKMREAILKLAIEHKASETSDYISVSIGVSATIPEKNISPSKLIEYTDGLLYSAKTTGRNRSCALMFSND